ncbi:MAG: LysM peptidoglycan-binding domain-containing protein [Mariprofundaceae bacterium]|nr:LysM peptidoglycan-binding domain-containing protein [Mariprofundaceae bacterium]
MKLQLRWLMLLVFFIPSTLCADAFLLPGEVAQEDLVKDFPQPYVVKKGDTLWDIADEYFAKPKKWLTIWEQNLQVSNPDLIYPGNEIWLKIKQPPVEPKEPEFLRDVVELKPRVIYKPAERIETEVDTRMLLTALARQDFIKPEAVNGNGHILDSEDERLNYGAFDKVYLQLDEPANPGDVFDIFRTGDPIFDPTSERKKLEGYLVNHLGSVQVTSVESGVYRGTILKAFEEIGRTDRLKPSKPKDYVIKPDYPTGPFYGRVMYVRNDAAEAGQGQIVGINLGAQDGLQPGSVLALYRMGRLIVDKRYDEKTYQALPEEKIGELIVLVPQDNASIALITRSSSAVNKGDIVQALPSR